MKRSTVLLMSILFFGGNVFAAGDADTVAALGTMGNADSASLQSLDTLANIYDTASPGQNAYYPNGGTAYNGNWYYPNGGTAYNGNWYYPNGGTAYNGNWYYPNGGTAYNGNWYYPNGGTAYNGNWYYPNGGTAYNGNWYYPNGGSAGSGFPCRINSVPYRSSDNSVNILQALYSCTN